MANKWYSEDQVFGSIPPQILATKSGLEICHGMMKGEYPPPTIGKALNFRMTEAEEGRVVFAGWPSDEYYNPAGTVHGGWTGAILDSALACCVWTMVPVGKAATTVEFKLNLVRPMLDGIGEVYAEGKVVHMGRTLATSEATLKTKDGKLIAHGTETSAIFSLTG